MGIYNINKTKSSPDMMEWNVIYYNVNADSISHFNVFKHAGFYEDLKNNYFKNKNNPKNFLNELKSSAKYYFWSKCEWEIVVTSWPKKDKVDAKIDVYDQLAINWDRFTEYVITNIGNEFLDTSSLYMKKE